MPPLRETFWPLRPFGIASGLWLAFLASAVLSRGYEGSFLWLNSLYSSAGDAVFPQLTHLGDALVVGGLAAVVMTRRAPELVVVLLLSLILTGIVSNVAKHYIFNDWYRPAHYFGAGAIHLLPGEPASRNSFPSGHSLTAGAAFTILAFYFTGQAAGQILCALLMACVGFSRIYLGMHFPGDVLAGTFIGLTISAGLVLGLRGRIERWVNVGRRPKSLSQLWLALGVLALLAGVLNRYVFSVYQ